jgi:transcriptional regulator with XRE-family HTH domain
MKVGERIRKLRKTKGYSADFIAEQLHVSRSTIFRYENGDIEKVPSDFILELATLLDTTPGVIMGWEHPQPKSIQFNEHSKAEDFPDHYTQENILVAKEYLKFFDSKTNGYFTGSYDFDSLTDDEILQFANEFKRFEHIRKHKMMVTKAKK